jgi:hypothetical protein
MDWVGYDWWEGENMAITERVKKELKTSELVESMNITIEVNITGLRGMLFRLWLAHKIIKVLEWVVRPIKVEERI